MINLLNQNEKKKIEIEMNKKWENYVRKKTKRSIFAFKANLSFCENRWILNFWQYFEGLTRSRSNRYQTKSRNNIIAIEVLQIEFFSLSNFVNYRFALIWSFGEKFSFQFEFLRHKNTEREDGFFRKWCKSVIHSQ